jgi:hypothetical protein
MNVKTINSIEISSLCDNRCPYCPSPIQGEHRPVGLMSFETFELAVKWALYFAREGTQREINLFGVGEPTLHPDLVKFIAYARQTLPFKQVLHLNTNGNTMTEQLARDLKAAGVDHIDITGHDARATAACIRIFRRVGIAGKLSIDYMTQPNNWAGQVDWFSPEYDAGPCPWIGRGQVMVMSSGLVTRCCIDAFGRGIMGSVEDDLAAMAVMEFELCRSCHHKIA